MTFGAIFRGGPKWHFSDFKLHFWGFGVPGLCRGAGRLQPQELFLECSVRAPKFRESLRPFFGLVCRFASRFANFGCLQEFGVCVFWKIHKNPPNLRIAPIFVNSPCVFFSGNHTHTHTEFTKKTKFTDRLANRPFFGLVCRVDS